MKRYRHVLIWIAMTALVSACDSISLADDPKGGLDRKPDVIYVPTPEPVVAKMLSMAKVGPGDVVYDLGCGDGRIPIAAVRDFGAKAAVCIDIDPERVEEARANVKRAGLEGKVEVRHADMFQVDTSPATVVTLYLLETLNVRLRPKLQRELRDGARIVSQSFSMGDWQPVAQARVADKPVYLWTITK
jgi:cyclopropane fatty-acyl-phospholipid synthase-like methyltransferase